MAGIETVRTNRFAFLVSAAIGALLFLCVAMIPASASAAPAIMVQGSGAFGAAANPTTRERAYSGAKYVGATHVRELVEKHAGFTWADTTTFVNNTIAQGLKPYLTLTYEPIENGGTLTPTVPGFATFCSEAASEYGSKVNDYGVFNEPHTYTWNWKDGKGKDGSDIHPAQAVDYGALYRACYAAIKAVNSNARVYIGELSNGASNVSPCNYLSNAVAAAKTETNGVGIHPYQFNVAPGTAVAGSTCRGIGRVGEWPSQLAAMTNLRTPSKGVPPLAITEFGYCASATQQPCDKYPNAPTSESTRASWMMTALSNANIAGATLFAQYHLVSTDPAPKWDTGIMGTDGTVREQMNALRTFSGATWGAPGVTTGAVVQGGTRSVTVSGQVDAHGFAGTTYRFEYGTNSGSLNLITDWQDAGAGTVAATFNALIGNLTPDTQYYYRIVAKGPGGTSTGSVQAVKTFADGSPSVILDQSNDQMWVHSRDPLSGKLRFAKWSPSTPWTTTDLGNPVRPGTTPTAIFDDSSKLQWVFYVHTNGDIGYRYWDGTTWQESGLTAPKQVAPGTNPVAVLDQTDNQRWVWWVDTSGILNYWNWSPNTGVWTNYSMGTAVAPGTSPTVTLNQTTKEQSVFYVKPDMSIGQWRWAAGQPWHQGSLGGPVRANTSPTALYDQKTGQQWVFYVNQNGDVAWWNLPPGAPAWVPAARPGPVRPNTNLSVTYDPSDSQTWVWFVHTNGDIVCWNWKASTNWVSFSLTGPGPVSPGTSLAPALDLKTKEQWVHYRNAGGENSYWNWTSSGNWKHYGS